MNEERNKLIPSVGSAELRQTYDRLIELNEKLVMFNALLGVSYCGEYTMAFCRRPANRVRQAQAVRDELEKIWKGLTSDEQKQVKRWNKEDVESLSQNLIE